MLGPLRAEELAHHSGAPRAPVAHSAATLRPGCSALILWIPCTKHCPLPNC